MSKHLPAILFAALANVLLLAHGVIPHHHHGDAVCFEVGHCFDCEVAHSGDCDGGHDSDQPAEQQGGCCLLDQMVMFHPDGLKDDLEDAGQPTEMKYPAGFLTPIIPESFFALHFSLQLPFREHPPDFSILAGGATQTPGLRAPPLV